MATETQLSLVSETLHLPGSVKFTPRGLSFAPDITEGELLSVGRSLFAARSYLKWGLGSLFAAMIQARPHPDQKRHAGDYDDTWAIQFADAHQLDPKERREMLGVFMFYRSCKQTPPLSFEHHREAMWGVDDGQPGQLTRALSFLDWAHESGASVTQLRRHIRTRSATEQAEPRQLELAAYSVVFDFMRFAKRELPTISTYTPERAAIILRDLGQETIEYIDCLRVIAAQANPSRSDQESRKSQKNRVAVHSGA